MLLTGNISNTRIYELAEAAANDRLRRPLVVLYFSDCDPWGWNMGIEAARKLQALQAFQLPKLQFRVYRAALTPAQVVKHKLPESPIEITGTEKQQAKKAAKRRRWKAAHDVEQVEIDSLATLRPELLREIAEDWIKLFYDKTLGRRVRAAAQEWEEQAQRVIDDEIDQDGLDDAVTELDRLRDEIQEVIDDQVDPILEAADEIELPDYPDMPEARIDTEAQPIALVDSRWEWAEQTKRLIASKGYDVDDDSDDEDDE